jgi:hypothetical protein
VTSEVQPMTSARIGDGLYEVIGTSTACVVRRVPWVMVNVVQWELTSDGKLVRMFDTKREALQFCQEHAEL